MDGGYYAPNITCELLPSVSQPSTEGACVHGGCAQAKGCFVVVAGLLRCGLMVIDWCWIVDAPPGTPYPFGVGKCW